MEHITHRHIERHRQLSWIPTLYKLAKFRHKHIKGQDILVISSFIGLSCYLSLHRITYPTQQTIEGQLDKWIKGKSFTL